ncbi:50S ribosomal protein L3 [candidate division WWE3 bacterium RBG_16_52_45]|nr:MAG: 50S ribosomal protein L3 [candidate division WWE3 bacterium RBG_16_52_45]
MKKIEARKLDMAQVFTEDGNVHPVTAVSFEEFPTDLTPGTRIRVVGISKGKGFSGVMKRHGFKGMPATHGRSTKGRAPGSIGGTTTPGRVYRGKRMAGRMGGEQVTIQGLSVLEVDPESKTAKISGALPGPRLSGLTIIYEPQVSEQSVADNVPPEENQPQAEGNPPVETPEAKSQEEGVKEKEETTNES